MAKFEPFKEFQVKEPGRTAQDERSNLEWWLACAIVLGAGLAVASLKGDWSFLFTILGIALCATAVVAVAMMHYAGPEKKS
jgi:drug/metabolite transporter (DMT)-like permease